MARANNAAQTTPAPISSSETVRVRGRANLPDGVGSPTFRDSMGNIREDPGRYRAGHYWPRNRFSEECEVTLDQLAELEADKHLEIVYEGKPALPPPAKPVVTFADKDARIRDLERQLREKDGEIDTLRRSVADQVAHQSKQLRTEYMGRIHELEGDVKTLIATWPRGQMPRPETSDEKRRAQPADED
jgi:hypothetical protein